MTALTTTPSVQALAWALVHFLWQGAAIGIIVFLWLRVRRPSAQARYAAGILALAALLAAPVGTFLWLAAPAANDPVTVVGEIEPVERAVAAADLAPPAAASALPAVADDSRSEARTEVREIAAAAIVAAWAIGVLLLSLRLAGGWILARRLVVRASTPAPPEVRSLAERLSVRLGLTRAIRIVESSTVSVPVLVGWLKPVVLLPVSALSGLSTRQVEALIAHELAHVRRHDYIVNILQSIVETLLFYHPAVWLISREVRETREHCCDDLAIGVCDRVVYVTALADLASISQAPQIALAATGGSLLSRVQRLLGHPTNDGGPGAAWLGVLSLALVLGGVMPPAVDSATAPAPVMTGDLTSGQLESGGREAAREGDAVGVARGVPGGMAGGVPGGVVGGVPGGIAGAVSPERRETRISAGSPTGPEHQESLRQLEEVRRLQGSAADDQAVQQRMEETRRAIENRLADIERQIAVTQGARQEPGGAAPDLASRLEVLAVRALAEVRVARSELERSRSLFQAGVLPSPALREIEARVAAAGRELTAIAVVAEITANEAATRDTIDTRRAQLLSESRIAESEAELAAARQSLESVEQRLSIGGVGFDELNEAGARLRAAERRLDITRREHQITQEELALGQQRIDVLRRLVREMQAAGARDPILTPENAPRFTAAPVTDPAARIQPADILSIEVAGEPDLPTTYTVDADSTIRLPLVGRVEVKGLTAQQARDAVVAALAQRRLAEGRAVTVTLRRPQ